VKLLLTPLQGAIRRALEFDPDSRARIRALHGRKVEVSLTGVQQTVYVAIHQEEVLLSMADSGQPDLRLEGSPIAFARYVMAPDKVEITDSGIKIEGDVALAQRFVGLLREVDIDWEEWASRYLGDVAAYRAGRIARGFFEWARGSERQARGDVKEYLQEEARLLAPRERVKRLMSDIDDIRSDVERLSQRVQRLRDSA
jgi:ubiquinone biosynthesis protein UbiJ